MPVIFSNPNFDDCPGVLLADFDTKIKPLDGTTATAADSFLFVAKPKYLNEPETFWGTSGQDIAVHGCLAGASTLNIDQSPLQVP